MKDDVRGDDEDRIVRLLRRRKVRRNVARAAIREHQIGTHPGEGSLADSLVMTARLRNTPGYRKALRRSGRRKWLIRLGLRKQKPSRPVAEFLAELRAEREAL